MDFRPEGQRAALSHTGHMSGRSDLYSALFAHFGFVEVDDMDQLLDITAMLASDAIPTGRGVGIFTASGGAGAWLIDALNRTPDFIAAFAQAKGEIAKWERQDRLLPSEPQMAVGKGIAAQLARWRDGLELGPTVPFQPATQPQAAMVAHP